MNDALMSLDLELADEADTEQLGCRLARTIQPPLIIYLRGELGAGKTRLARAVLHGLGHEGNVKSPTYTLIEPYQLAQFKLYHFDLYRLADPLELEYMGIRDYFMEDSVALVEWPDKGQGILMPADLEIEMQYAELGRKCSIRAISDAGNQCIEDLKQSL